MTTRTTPRLWPLAEALAIAATVGVLMPTADHWANAECAAKAEANAKAAQEIGIRIAAAAQALCESTHGPGAAHWWDADGALVCAAEQRATTVAQGVAQ